MKGSVYVTKFKISDEIYFIHRFVLCSGKISTIYVCEEFWDDDFCDVTIKYAVVHNFKGEIIASILKEKEIFESTQEYKNYFENEKTKFNISRGL